MKKHSESSKSVKKVRIGSRFHNFAAVFVILLTAITGAATLRFSLADAGSEINITVTDTVKHIGVSGVGVGLSNHTSGETPCNPTIVSTTSTGVAAFTNCTSATIYEISHLSVESRGYTVNSDSEKHLGSLVMPSGTWYSIAVHPIDTDGDGTPDNTPGYPQDNCPNAAGPGSNGGCPIAAAPAPPIAPAPTAPSSTTSKPSAPAPKKTTTSSNKSTPAASTPAVVTATQGDTTPPTKPGDLSIDVSDDTAYLSWSDATDNVGVIGYNVDRSTDNKQWDSIAVEEPNIFASDSSIVGGQRYYYRVQAVDAAGNLSESNVAGIDVAKTA
jgi:hypothetical protein